MQRPCSRNENKLVAWWFVAYDQFNRMLHLSVALLTCFELLTVCTTYAFALLTRLHYLLARTTYFLVLLTHLHYSPACIAYLFMCISALNCVTY